MWSLGVQHLHSASRQTICILHTTVCRTIITLTDTSKTNSRIIGYIDSKASLLPQAITRRSLRLHYCILSLTRWNFNAHKTIQEEPNKTTATYKGDVNITEDEDYDY